MQSWRHEPAGVPSVVRFIQSPRPDVGIVFHFPRSKKYFTQKEIALNFEKFLLLLLLLLRLYCNSPWNYKSVSLEMIEMILNPIHSCYPLVFYHTTGLGGLHADVQIIALSQSEKENVWLVLFPCSWTRSWRTYWLRTRSGRHCGHRNRRDFDRAYHDRFVLLLLQFVRRDLLLSPGPLRWRRR